MFIKAQKVTPNLLVIKFTLSDSIFIVATVYFMLGVYRYICMYVSLYAYVHKISWDKLFQLIWLTHICAAAVLFHLFPTILNSYCGSVRLCIARKLVHQYCVNIVGVGIKLHWFCLLCFIKKSAKNKIRHIVEN